MNELPRIYEQISEELASQYTIAYASKNPLRNGAWRRIIVRTKRPGAVPAHPPGLLRADQPLTHGAGPSRPLHRRRDRLRRCTSRAARRATGRVATAVLSAGVLAHTFLIGMQTVEAGHAPLVGTTSAISAFVWLLALAYLYTELTTDERAMGMLVAVLLAVLDIIPAFNPTVVPRPEVLRSPLFTIHVASLLFAYASFALACVLGVTYVLLFKEIKAKHLGFFYARLPSLQVLDAMNGRVLTIGWLFLTHRAGGRRHLGHAGAKLAGSACPGDVGGRPEDPRRAGLVGRVLFRPVCPAGDRLDRPTRRLAVGDRVRDRAAELRAGRLLPDEEPQFQLLTCDSWS